MAKRCVLKVTIDSLQEVLNDKSIDTKMNDLDLCLEVVSSSCQPLRYIQLWISRKTLEIEAWFQRTTNRKWPTGNQKVTWPMNSHDPKGETSDPNTLRAQYVENRCRCYLATIAH